MSPTESLESWLKAEIDKAIDGYVFAKSDIANSRWHSRECTLRDVVSKLEELDLLPKKESP